MFYSISMSFSPSEQKEKLYFCQVSCSNVTKFQEKEKFSWIIIVCIFTTFI